MSKISLTDLVNLQNETTAVNAINANNAALTTAFDNTLSRDGTTPNTMSATLDMNSNHIINLPAPTSNFDPLRAIDVNTINGSGLTVSPLPIDGTAHQVLAKNTSTNFDVAWASVNSLLTAGSNIAVTGTSPATISTSLTPAFTSVSVPTLINTGTLTLPTSTDTLVGRATADTLTNKTLVSPTLTGAPVAPTAPIGTNTTQIATTAYVLANGITQQFTSANSVGFVGDGVTDNLAAWNAWKATVGTTGACLEFGVGKYVFSANISLTMRAGRQVITIRGLGSNLSTLHWPAGGGMTITAGHQLNSVHVRDLTFTTGAVNTGTGLLITSPGFAICQAQQSEVRDCEFKGDDFDDINANVHYWNVALQVAGWSNINILYCNTYGLIGAPGTSGGGTGFVYGGVGTNIAAVMNCYFCSFQWHTIGSQLNDYWEGVTFGNCNWQGEVGTVGHLVQTGFTHAGPYLNFFGNQFNSGGVQVSFLSPVPQVIMVGNTLTVFGNSNSAVSFGTSSSVIFQNNIVNLASGTGTAGIIMNGANGTVGGNIFTNVTTGVLLNSGSSNTTVSQNQYPGVTTQVTNTGTSNSVGTVHN